MPAHGKPTWTGSTFATTSPTDLDLSSQSRTLSTLWLTDHLFCSQTFLWSAAASYAACTVVLISDATCPRTTDCSFSVSSLSVSWRNWSFVCGDVVTGCTRVGRKAAPEPLVRFRKGPSKRSRFLWGMLLLILASILMSQWVEGRERSKIRQHRKGALAGQCMRRNHDLQLKALQHIALSHSAQPRDSAHVWFLRAYSILSISQPNYREYSANLSRQTLAH